MPIAQQVVRRTVAVQVVPCGKQYVADGPDAPAGQGEGAKVKVSAISS